jgi:hypothetical protein
VVDNKDTVQILQAVHGVSERVARLEEKLDEYNKIRATAYAAKEQAEDNRQAIVELKDDYNWTWKTAATTAITLLGKIVYDVFRGPST